MVSVWQINDVSTYVLLEPKYICGSNHIFLELFKVKQTRFVTYGPLYVKNTTEKNITNTLTLVPVGMHVGFEGPRHVLLY